MPHKTLWMPLKSFHKIYFSMVSSVKNILDHGFFLIWKLGSNELIHRIEAHQLITRQILVQNPGKRQ